MARGKLKAAFYRGGTSKAVVFNGADLPADRAVRDAIFLRVLGSPDPYKRQLNGMGGGISSLSKVVIVEPSARPDADVDYTFVQIAVDAPVADYGAACGNMSSCVGPFAVEEGLVIVADGEALVRIYNTNTGQIYHSRFPVQDGLPVEEGAMAIPGVAGTGAAVKLDFLSPGGSRTGRLLPTGNPIDHLDIEGVGHVETSLVDAANPVIFLPGDTLGKRATETPWDLDADQTFMSRMEAIRRAGGVAMGLGDTPAAIGRSNPKVAIVGPATSFTALDGRRHDATDCDLTVRLISMENTHRAITLTGGMCAAVAAKIPGTLLAHLAGTHDILRIGTPSGVLPVSADVSVGPDGPKANSASTFRTQRRLMEGAVLYSSPPWT